MPRRGIAKTARIGAFVLALGAPVTLSGEARGPRVRATAPAFATLKKTRRPPPTAPPPKRAVWPVPPWIRAGSGYGRRPGRRTGRPTFHAGVDFPAPRGTPVYAVSAGRVVKVVADAERVAGFRGYGNAVLVHHPEDDCWTLYAHLKAAFAREGANVSAGTPIGSVGRTSNRRFRKMGPHLHLEVRRRRPDGEPPFPGPYRANNVDPERWLAARGVIAREGRFFSPPASW